MFKAGIYEHYKGGLYRAYFIAERHTHNGDLDVVYFSLKTGKTVSRPFTRDSRNEDSWTDIVTWPDGSQKMRFKYKGANL
jgi:hypothetical protein